MKRESGFTLLEVLVTLTILAVGAALTLSLVSASLGNIRKVRLRTRAIEHARQVMELALVDDTITGPSTLAGDYEDGTRWSVAIGEMRNAGAGDRDAERANDAAALQGAFLCRRSHGTEFDDAGFSTADLEAGERAGDSRAGPGAAMRYPERIHRSLHARCAPNDA